MRIIGAPKSLNDLQTFNAAELSELFSGMEEYVTSGVPMEVPASIPVGQLGRIVVTLKRYHAVVAGLSGLPVNEELTVTPFEKAAMDLKEIATSLISASVNEKPKSRIVVPR
jgi:hypothetical protein